MPENHNNRSHSSGYNLAPQSEDNSCNKLNGDIEASMKGGDRPAYIQSPRDGMTGPNGPTGPAYTKTLDGGVENTKAKEVRVLYKGEEGAFRGARRSTLERYLTGICLLLLITCVIFIVIAFVPRNSNKSGECTDSDGRFSITGCIYCIHRIASSGYYGFRFVTPPPQCVERFYRYRCNEKSIIASLLKFCRIYS